MDWIVRKVRWRNKRITFRAIYIQKRNVKAHVPFYNASYYAFSIKQTA